MLFLVCTYPDKCSPQVGEVGIAAAVLPVGFPWLHSGRIKSALPLVGLGWPMHQLCSEAWLGGLVDISGDLGLSLNFSEAQLPHVYNE